MQGKIPHTRHYIKVADRLVHYRRCGSGPALILQHASPLTSESLLPAMSVFSERFTCIALDNPGYGLSDPLPERDRADLDAYAKALKATLEALKIDQPIIYGASTGGAITHKFGCMFPEAARLLMLDTFSHMDTEETTDGYFPDVGPKEDGSHLLAYWNKLMRLFLFRPWQRSDMERRQVRDLPSAEVLHSMLLQQLTAGTDYKHLYRAAIAYEDDENIAQLKTQATINVWEGAPSFQKVKSYLDGVLPDNYVPIHSKAGPNGRYTHQLSWLVENGLADGPALEAPPSEEKTARLFVETDVGEVHIKRTNGTRGPVLLLHDWGQSSAQFQRFVQSIGPTADLIAPDLPGHGATPAPMPSGHDWMPSLIAALIKSLDDLDVETCSIVGVGAGAIIGASLKHLHPDRVSSLSYLATAPIRSDIKECAQLLQAAPDFAPLASGAHCINAFDVARAKSAFWRWEVPIKQMALGRPDAMDADRLHQETFDLLRSNNNWRDLPSKAASWLQTRLDIQATLKRAKVFAPGWVISDRSLAVHLAPDFERPPQVLPQDESLWSAFICDALDI